MSSALSTARFSRMANVISRAPWAFAAGAFAIVLVLALLSGNVYLQRQVIMVLIYTLMVSGLNLTFGYAGDLALGHVAMFAAGAYLTAILANHGVKELLIAVPVSILGAAAVAVISGAPGLRLSGWSLAITSLFVVTLVPRIVVIAEAETGGRQGLSATYGPELAGFDLDFLGFYAFAGAVTLLWLLLMRNFVVSTHGRSLAVLAESRQLTESLGTSPYSLRMRAYLVGSAPAGIAGTVYAYLVGFVSPEVFSLVLAIAILAAAVVGGTSSVWGAPIGAAILIFGPLQSAEFEQFSILIYGVFLLLAGLLFAGGIAGVWHWLVNRFGGELAQVRELAIRRRIAQLDLDVEDLHVPGERLVASGISKQFGGVPALQAADALAEPGRITAILGANGAGKTTLLNTVSGFIRADAGSITLDQTELLRLTPAAIARRGVGRTFQTPHIPQGMTVLDVVLSAHDHKRPSLLAVLLRFPSHRRFEDEALARSWKAISFAGLAGLEFQDAKSLPLGTRRLLEVVRAVSARPGLLLLDEPAAGLDDDALEDLARLMRRIRDAGGTVVLVEHNVPFVMGLVDNIHVMELGRTIARGTPAEVADDPAVIASYLGETVVGVDVSTEADDA